MTALSAWLLLSVGVLLLACVAYLRRRHEPVLIEDAPPIFPHDHPIACLGCGRVHKGPCLKPGWALVCLGVYLLLVALFPDLT